MPIVRPGFRWVSIELPEPVYSALAAKTRVDGRSMSRIAASALADVLAVECEVPPARPRGPVPNQKRRKRK